MQSRLVFSVGPDALAAPFAAAAAREGTPRPGGKRDDITVVVAAVGELGAPPPPAYTSSRVASLDAGIASSTNPEDLL